MHKNVSQREEGREANRASVLHGLDVRSRKAISTVMASTAADPLVDGKTRSIVARTLNDARKRMMDAVCIFLLIPNIYGSALF